MQESDRHVLRSLLFVPGDQPRKVQKALAEIPTDAVILDLEDAVAISAKAATRAPVGEALTQPRRPRAYVRVNGVETPWFFGDLDAVVGPSLDGVMLPKTASDEMLYVTDRYLTHLEGERGVAAGAIDLIPLIESAQGVANLAEICARRPPRVKRLGLGAADLTADLGMVWTPEEQELLMVRTQLVLHSRAGGLEAPLDTVYPHFRDRDGLEATCHRSRALGFQGRTCIHPDQIEPVNRIYAPTADEVAWAEEVLAAFAEAEARGVAAIAVREQLIDYAFVVRARSILDRSRVGRGGAS